MMGSISANTAALTSSVTPPMRQKERNTLCFMRPISRAPQRMENTTPLPMHSPRNMEVRNIISGYAAPTAASAFAPSTRPTISVSAMLYNCCSILPTVIGRANSSMVFVMEPVVRSRFMDCLRIKMYASIIAGIVYNVKLW